MFWTGAPVAASRLDRPVRRRRRVRRAEEAVDVREPAGGVGRGLDRQVEVDALKRGVCSNWGRSIAAQPQPGPVSVAVGVEVRDVAGREGLVGLVVVVQGQADLLQVVDALRPPGRLARRLDGGQQQARSGRR